MVKSNRKPKGTGSRGFKPQLGQTKKMACAICKKNGLKWTWFTYVNSFWKGNYWRCNTH